MSLENILPNFMIIGAMKSGTTSLHSYLSFHEDIYMSKKKEIDFFCHDEKFINGLDWYGNHFEEGTLFRGESSQNYSKYHLWPDTAKRIYNCLGNDVKFVYILRDPIERIYSHYNEMQAQNCAPESLENYLRIDTFENEMVLSSCYAYQLDKFLEFFPISSIKIVTLEDLKENPLLTVNEICNFLDLSSFTMDEHFIHKSNTSDSKVMRRRHIRKILDNTLVKRLLAILPFKLKDLMREYIFHRLMFKNIGKDTRLSDELLRDLRAIFREDVKKLEQITSLKFDNWDL